MERNIKELINQLTVDEKATIIAGADNWHLSAVPKLNIPEIMVCDGPHGLRKQDEKCDVSEVERSVQSVCFPTASATSCCFNPELLEEIGQTLGDEALYQNVGIILGPACNIKRSPICGRNFEYFSEDPLLSTTCAGALIKGIQSKGVGACIKHFAANNQEHRRLTVSSDIAERPLHEIYLASFEGAVRVSHPWSVMCSYNRINGIHSSENKELLTDVLRKDWGFDGIVMSDWGAVDDRVKACIAGLDLEMPGPAKLNHKKVVEAVQNGLLDEQSLNSCVERVLDVKFRILDGKKEGNYDLEKHHQIARKIGEECVVLLKNDNQILPLKKEQKVAFIGPYATKPRYQGGGSSHINSFKVTNAFECAKKISSNISYSIGCDGDNDLLDENQLKDSIELAKVVDVAVVFAGLPDIFESEAYDRKHMRIPNCQCKLITEIAKVQPNMVVVLHNGSPIEMPWLDKVSAVVENYLCGQAVGEITANVLYGIVNPSGHLSETFPLKYEDNPSILDFGAHHDHVNYMEGVFVGYRYYDKKNMEVLFPFGHGLSYTTFSYSNLRFDKDHFKDTEKVKCHVDVANIGPVFGKCVVQLYVSDKTDYENRPLKELKGFKKVSLEPGEMKTVDIELNKRSFAYWNTEIHNWYAPTGEYEILIGNSSRDIRIHGKVHVESTTKIVHYVTNNSTFADVYDDPITKPALDKMLINFPSQKEWMDNDDEEHKFWRICVRDFPLRSLTLFFEFKGDEIEQVIKDANMLIDASNK